MKRRYVALESLERTISRECLADKIWLQTRQRERIRVARINKFLWDWLGHEQSKRLPKTNPSETFHVVALNFYYLVHNRNTRHLKNTTWTTIRTKVNLGNYHVRRVLVVRIFMHAFASLPFPTFKSGHHNHLAKPTQNGHSHGCLSKTVRLWGPP